MGVCNLAAWQIACSRSGFPGREGTRRDLSAPRCITASSAATSSMKLCRSVATRTSRFCRGVSLAGGFLTGKYRRDQRNTPKGAGSPRASSASSRPSTSGSGSTWSTGCWSSPVAHDTSPTTIAIKWLLTRPAVTSVIIGVRHLEQLSANLAATELDLPAEALDELSALTAPPELYPQWMIQRQTANNRTVWEA